MESTELRHTSMTPFVQSTLFNWQKTTTLNPTGADAANRTANLISAFPGIRLKARIVMIGIINNLKSDVRNVILLLIKEVNLTWVR